MIARAILVNQAVKLIVGEQSDVNLKTFFPGVRLPVPPCFVAHILLLKELP
jgi:hypothetical protein